MDPMDSVLVISAVNYTEGKNDTDNKCCEYACYEDPGCMCDPCQIVKLRAALKRIVAAHALTDGLGYTDDYTYSPMEAVCTTCGTSDEYGVQWPCYTVSIAKEALGEP